MSGPQYDTVTDGQDQPGPSRSSSSDSFSTSSSTVSSEDWIPTITNQEITGDNRDKKDSKIYKTEATIRLGLNNDGRDHVTSL